MLVLATAAAAKVDFLMNSRRVAPLSSIRLSSCFIKFSVAADFSPTSIAQRRAPATKEIQPRITLRRDGFQNSKHREIGWVGSHQTANTVRKQNGSEMRIQDAFTA